MNQFKIGFHMFWLYVYMCTRFDKEVLDNCDGKQARRTANSSSLGLLFDHGLDSLAAPITTMNALHFTGIKGIPFFFLTMLSSFAFYHTTYEQ